MPRLTLAECECTALARTRRGLRTHARRRCAERWRHRPDVARGRRSLRRRRVLSVKRSQALTTTPPCAGPKLCGAIISDARQTQYSCKPLCMRAGARGVCVRACACACARVRACVRVRVCVCARACARTQPCVRAARRTRPPTTCLSWRVCARTHSRPRDTTLSSCISVCARRGAAPAAAQWPWRWVWLRRRTSAHITVSVDARARA